MGKFMDTRRELNAYARELTGEKWPYHYRQGSDHIDIERVKELGRLQDRTTTITVYADQEPKAVEITRWYDREVVGSIGINSEKRQESKNLTLDDLTEHDLKMVERVKQVLTQ